VVDKLATSQLFGILLLIHSVIIMHIVL